VPTRLVSDPSEAADAARELGGERWVVKPAVGAGSMGVRIWDGRSELAFSGDHLIQPYLESVERGGERALVWIDGEFTHKVVKQRRLADDDEAVSNAEPLTAAERAFGEAVIASAPEGLLYARVDVMEGPAGEIWLSELELVEPSLFLVQNPEAAARLAEGVKRRLHQAP
jgi:glutathione synthase/RimK-type ligase-like ATP-grasp enzyme